MPGLNDLRMFETAARLRNFRQAAEELHLTHGAVSHRMRALEEQLGVVLFDRRDNMRLTPAGLELQGAATEALRLLGGAIERIVQHYRPQGGTVRLSVLRSMATRFLLPRWQSFQMSHPGVSLQIDASVELAQFGEHGVDLALRYGSGSWPDMRAQWLMDDAYYPVAAPAFLAGRAPVRAADLLTLPLVGFSVVRDFGADWNRMFNALALPTSAAPSITMFDDIELALQAAEHGMGVALARHSMVFDAIQQGRLERVLDVGLRGNFRHYIVAPRNRIDSAAELSVIDWLEGQARQFSADGAAELAGLRWLD
jgi:LysR family glycine cleavage system transcriptional activator